MPDSQQNPFASGTSQASLQPREQDRSFSRSFWWIVAAGLLMGAVVGVLIHFAASSSNGFPMIWIGPAVGWLLTLGAVFGFMRGTRLSGEARIAVAVLMAIPAYILYVPTCGFTAPMLDTVLPGPKPDPYWPNLTAGVTASAAAYCLILVAAASIFRRIYRLRDPVDESN